MFEDPHFTAREAIIRLAHPDFGELPMQNAFPRLSETPGSVRHLGPELGEHNTDVYSGLLSIPEGELAALSEHGII
jgi:crotonobetainyl-CoA:carnitine CoA-transferase CaiB-like acyl-CoA transferase